jgi:hypothetical protein
MAGSDNINANRLVTGATNAELNETRILLNNQSTSPAPTFQRAVVEEVVYNPKDLTSEDKDRIRAAVINPEFVDQIAANSVVAVLIADGISNANPTRVLLGPFFQSHMMLPVQAGEQVMVVFDDFQKFNFRQGKWLTRASEGLQTEDPNFTHNDRRFNATVVEATRTSVQVARSGSVYTPNFPNGAGQSNTNTLPQNDSTNPYDLIYRKTISGSLQHQYEPVPRWTKRPQEFVLQGMNNSLIMLGQDRVGYVTGSSATEQKAFAGTIDMVAGRSRYMLSTGDSDIPTSQLQHKGTSPLLVTSSRDLVEVDKTPKLNNRNEQLKEGDPDFVRDAARIYVSMKTLGDTNFRLAKTTEGNVANALQSSGINYSANSLYPVQFSSSSANVGSSYVVAKADHVRIVGRRSVPAEDSLDPVINGSVLILKEGKNRTPEDKNVGSANTDHLAYLYMSPEGRVQVDGLQIFLGGSSIRQANTQTPASDRPSSISGSSPEITVGDANEFAGSEPYIKWSEFKNVVEGLQRQINDLHDAYSDLVDGIQRAANGGPNGSVCQPGGPDVAWSFLSLSTIQERNKLNQKIQEHRLFTNRSVYKSRSAKIFGQ